MRTLGFIVSAIGALIAIFMTMIFGLIIFVLGLIVVSLNKEEASPNKTELRKLEVKKSNFQMSIERVKSKYVQWSRNKFGKWSKRVNFLIGLVIWRVPLLVLALVIYFVATEDVENQDWKDFNCGLAIIVSNVTDPLSNMDLTDKICFKR